MAKICIEDCLVLTASKMAKIPRLYTRMVTWGNKKNYLGKISVSRTHELDLKLEYQVDGKHISYDVSLNTTPLPWDCLRYWFSCPTCDRRVAHLYKPHYHHSFLCRHCHDLTYRSRQVNNRWSRMFKAIDRL